MDLLDYLSSSDTASSEDDDEDGEDDSFDGGGGGHEPPRKKQKTGLCGDDDDGEDDSFDGGGGGHEPRRKQKTGLGDAGLSGDTSSTFSSLGTAEKAVIAEGMCRTPGNHHVRGSANLFEYNSENSFLHHKVIHGRSIVPSKIPMHLIDNTNLHDACKHGHAPLVAYSTSAQGRWMLGIGLSIFPTFVLIQPIILDCDGTVKQQSYHLQPFTMDPMEIACPKWKDSGVIDKPIAINYLNYATMAGLDSFVKCDPRGPTSFELNKLPLSPAVTNMLDEARSKMSDSCFLVSDKGVLSPTTSMKRAGEATSRKRASRIPYGSQDDEERKCSILWATKTKVSDSDDGLVSVEFLGHPDAEDGAPVFGKMRTDQARILTKSGRVLRSDLLQILDSLCTSVGGVSGHEVPENGCWSLFETDDPSKIGTVETDVRYRPPQEIGGLKYAQFEVRKGDVELDNARFQFLLDYTLGNNKVDRSCSECVGRNWYGGPRGSTQPAASARTPKEDCIPSQLQRAWVDPTFQPYMNSCMSRLTGKSLAVRDQFDPLFTKLVSEVNKLDAADRSELARDHDIPGVARVNRVGHSSNRVQIVTSDNGKGFFAIGEHVDKLDGLGKGFALYALEHLSNKYVNNFPRNPDAVRDVMHLLRLGNETSGGDGFAWSLPTTCGYAPVLHPARKASAWFHYHSFGVAVKIPMNVVSYNTWLSNRVKHSTGLTYTYDDKYVYFRDEFPSPQKSIAIRPSYTMTCRVEDEELPEWATGLFLPAWGGSSSTTTKSRSAYVADFFPNAGGIRTIDQFVNLIREERMIGHARRHCPEGITDNVERAIRRSRG